MVRGGNTKMNSKLLVVGGLALAFVLGTAATGITTAFNQPAEEETVVTAPARRVASAPAVRTRTVTRPAAFVDSVESEPAVVETEKKRSLKKEILIVGG